MKLLLNLNIVLRTRSFRWLALLLGLGHLGFAVWTGLRGEHVLADGLLILLPWLGDAACQFIRASVPLWITGVIVDIQRYLPLFGPDPYRRFEKRGGVSLSLVGWNDLG